MTLTQTNHQHYQKCIQRIHRLEQELVRLSRFPANCFCQFGCLGFWQDVQVLLFTVPLPRWSWSQLGYYYYDGNRYVQLTEMRNWIREEISWDREELDCFFPEFRSKPNWKESGF